MLFDQVQVIVPIVEAEDKDLVVPFLDFGALHFWKQIYVVGTVRRSHLSPNVWLSQL